MPALKTVYLVGIAMAAGFAGGIIAGNISYTQASQQTNSQKEITAQAFHLVDKDGNHRGSFGFNQEGVPVLMFKNLNGSVPAYLGVYKGKPTMVFCNENGQMRLAIALASDGHPLIHFRNQDGSASMALQMKDARTKGIAFLDSSKKPRIFFGLTGDKPSLTFVDQNKRIRMAISENENHEVKMIIPGQDGKAEVALGQFRGQPGLLINKGHKTGMIVGYLPDGRPVLALNENGAPIFTAPEGAPHLDDIGQDIDFDDVIRDVLQ
jgi:hypothetical protein